MLQFSYVAALLFSYGSMLWLDRRLKLVWWKDPSGALFVQGVAWVFFAAWDLLAIHFGIFYPGESRFMTGWRPILDLPLEECLFLVFLTYQTLVYWELLQRWRRH